jgi:hypothetical protein
MTDATITFRLPEEQKRALDIAAEAKGIATNTLLRVLADDFVGSLPRRIESTSYGLTPRCDEFLSKHRADVKEHGPMVVVVLVRRIGDTTGTFYEGIVNWLLTNDSIVTIEHKTRRGKMTESRDFPLLRCDVVGMFVGAPTQINRLCQQLVGGGWRSATPGHYLDD